MRIDNPAPEKLKHYYSVLAERPKVVGKLQWTKYLDLGTHIIRLINYSPKFTPHIEKQLSYVLKDKAEKYDTTLIIWQDNDLKAISVELEEILDIKKNPKLRIEALVYKQKFDFNLQVYTAPSKPPLINIDTNQKILSAYDTAENTYYYAVENLEPEEFIKHGHIFVQTIGKIVRTPTTALAHGAVVGLNNKGILFCARGQRGKSTLAVCAMIDGFDYVSDDYLVLSKDKNGLYADPIYSIITLSPRMYTELYDTLRSKFVSNNSRKDKYVFNIADYHKQFVGKYPIRTCMFPQITTDSKPSIIKTDKSRSVVQLVHSTLQQMGDWHDIDTIRKLMSFVQDFEFYQINLCQDIWANLRCLREFAEKL